VARWQVYVTGWGTPDDFSIVRFNDAGTFLDAPLSIERATGSAKFTGKIVAAGASTTTIPGLGNTATGFYVGTEGTPAFMTVSRGQTECAHFNINASGENLVFYCSGVRVGTINVSPTATAYLTSSSAELKEDLRVFDAGRIVDNTNVYDFKWKSTGERAYGVIAQQANEVYPTAVTHNEERDWWGINYQAYIPILLQEMKALRARVAELEDKLSAKPS
jgi:hypothetical protein